MFYNRYVRPFTAAFDTIFVFGPKDQKALLASLAKGKEKEERRTIIGLMKEFQDSVATAMATSTETREIVVLFPYAGRATEDTGCKSEIPRGMTDILMDTRNMFCPMSCFGQRDAMPGGAGGSALRNFSIVKSIHPYISIGEGFIG